MKPAWKLFPNLTRIVAAEAARYPTPAHDFVAHDLVVAGYCPLIAPPTPRIEEVCRIAIAAALCHSMDRRFPNESKTDIGSRVYADLSESDEFTRREQNFIVNLVLNHKGFNKNRDGLALRMLRDADRLANLGLVAALRSAQLYHSLPTCNPKHIGKPNPEATYREPLTVLHDVWEALKWDPIEGHRNLCLQLPKAIEIGEPYFDWLKLGIKLAEQQIVETGIRKFADL